MSINIGPPAVDELRPRITVIGVGGAGGNAIANMINAEIEGVDFVVANTDAQSLNASIAEHRIQLGPEITQGLGAGSRPEVGKAAAEETIIQIERALEGVHMCFIAAGMGGGTGTGAAPVIAEVARRKGVLTVGVVTKPFLFEGIRRMKSAEAGIEELGRHVDTLIVIPNQNLFLVAKAETTFKEAFQLADEVLQQGVRSITDLMVMPGLINLDFADVRSVMAEMGKAMMGTGEGSGENRALEAAEKAIANPLLDGVSMRGAKGVIISIIGGDDMKLLEVDEAANHIRELVDPNANIIWGSAFNPDLQGKIRVSVVATGIEQTAHQAEEAARPIGITVPRGPVIPASAVASGPIPMSPAAERSFERSSMVPPAPELQPAQEPVAPLHLNPVTQPAGFKPAVVSPAQSIPVEHSAPAPQSVSDFDDTLELGAEHETGQALPLSAGEPGELLLDAGGIVEEPAGRRPPVDPFAPRRPAPEAEAAPSLAMPLPFDAQPVSAAGNAPAQEALPVEDAHRSSGGTLFERMANLTGRRHAAPEDDEDPGAVNIPRFLGRQNNQ